MAIETVLVAIGPRDVERAPRLAEEAKDVAGPSGATVVLAHVFTEEEYHDTLDKLDVQLEREATTPDDVARHNATIRDVADDLAEDGVDYEIRGIVGDPGEAIVELAGRTNADQVIVGGRKRSPTGKAVFGSVAQEVMLNAPCPVLYVRQGLE
ncbi:universal stress protein [Haloplanus sp. GCM10025708]|uniref:universal stress protein n=1 Tax=Haloferacaceae TaxID=1644056 RepID=UPI00360C48DB